VPEFRRWRLFEKWRETIVELGYPYVQIVELLATDFGVPQRRMRLFVVASRDPIDLGDLMIPNLLKPPSVEPPIGDVIDWHEGVWRPVAQARDGARARIEAGRRLGRRYWVQHVSHHTGASMARAVSAVHDP
jgi:site-specific DNA-cytosine methylase